VGQGVARLPVATTTDADNHLGGVAAANYRRFERDQIAPWLGRRVLEIGAGHGDLAAILPPLDALTVTDADPACLRILRARFAGRPDVTVRPLDLRALAARPEPVAAPGPAGPPRPDTIVMVNVLEHLADDVAALRAAAGLTVPGGRLVLWVPAHPALYGAFDARVGHHRRYTRDGLRSVVAAAGLTPERTRSVNLLGGVAWWLAVRRGGTRAVDPRLVRAYDRFLVPVTRRVDALAAVGFGQSLLCVARLGASLVPAARRGPA
jgi:SAM-dependent methyltransferase